VSIRAHKAPILARLRADSILAPVVFEGDVVGSPGGYVVFYASQPSHSVERFTGPQSQQDYTFTTVSVGKTPEQAQLIADRVVTQLLGFVPTVPGRTCRRLTHPVGRPIEREEDSTPSLWYFTDQWDLSSSPS
jgi:hypothetical protein